MTKAIGRFYIAMHGLGVSDKEFVDYFVDTMQMAVIANYDVDEFDKLVEQVKEMD